MAGMGRRTLARGTVSLLMACAFLTAGEQAFAAAGSTFTYIDFAAASDLILNGNASVSGAALRLSGTGVDESAAAWHGKPIDPDASFESVLHVSLHDGSTPPADGLALVLQSSGAGTAAIGRFGEGIGYGGITPSVEVEFDTWLNDWDPDANHIAVTTGGDETKSLAIAAPPFALYGAPFTAWVNYDAAGKRLSVFASQNAQKPAAPIVSADIDLSAVLGKSAPAYVGLTGGTGSNHELADVTSWSFGGPPTTAPRLTTAPAGLIYAPPTGTRKIAIAAASAPRLKIEVDRAALRPRGVKYDRLGLPKSPVRVQCSGLGVESSSPSVTCELSQTDSKIITVPLCFDLQSTTADFDQTCFQVRGGHGIGLGDSYASGEGGGGYVNSTAKNGLGVCDRSRYAASQQLFDRHMAKIRYDLLACTGFTSVDMQNVRVSRSQTYAPVATQLDYLDDDVTLVTLSAGGNDAGFSDDVSSCLKVTRCDIDPAFTTKLAKRLADIPGRLDALYGAVRAKAPNAQVLVQGYPYLFPKTGNCRRTDVRIYGAGTITPEEYHFMMREEERLNAMIATAAGEHGFTFVDVAAPTSSDSFAGHWSCGPDSWIHDLTLSSGASAKLKLSLEALHPTKEGQTHLANLLWAKLNRGGWTPPSR
ncbi:GDSL-type esterase/lipase family protein [Paractinoplanes lichenicola]|uniref:SGNH hydrolase-type esterase domain-containing protein n=1 Tax=Paractinoplanes lichenicola TaxID=2802976 RepID=A0ABS1VM29_9ACTN|nr:GDSL-type esterase/lipase family protein [Actinoplanes lichenicola]MBL7255546.1 hypothetical protein [Actinoplanes lichenicola]